MLIEELKRVTNESLMKGSLCYTETTVRNRLEGRINFLISIAPSLKQKPTALNTKDLKFNPFLPPDPDLIVKKDFSAHHSLLLNKYCITKHHCLLVTKEFVPQENLLEEHDFAAIVELLNQLNTPHQNQWLCFFNCGRNSGASQPHKHMQFIPFENNLPIHQDIVHIMKSHKSGELGRIPSFEGILHRFVHFENQSAVKMLGYYKSIIQELRHIDSYNVLMTKNWILVVARSKEKYRHNATFETSINSLGFCGMILVKSEEELSLVLDSSLLGILKEVSVSSE